MNKSEGLEEIGDLAFAGTGINKIKIPESCSKVGIFCFDRCKSLKDIYLPKSLTEIPKGLFNECSWKNLKIHSPNNLEDFNFEDFNIEGLNSKKHLKGV